MLGFETIGNATVIAYDGGPIIATDPWLGEPAYFGSWGLPFEIPEEQQKAIMAAEFLWFSHGHPDHLNPENIEKMHGRKILLPDHVGNRIRDALIEAGYDVTVMTDGEWIKLSDNVRVLCLSDYYQDAVLLIDVGGALIVNINDASDKGWGRRIKQFVRDSKRSFMLKLFGDGITDMMNFYDDDGHHIKPVVARKRPIGAQVGFYADLFGVTDVVPFSSYHHFERSDSVWANEYTRPMESFSDGYNGKATLHDAFVRYDAKTDTTTQLKPKAIPVHGYDPKNFGDDWSQPFEAGDHEKAKAYFQAIECLGDGMDFIRLVAGGQELMIDTPGKKTSHKTGRGVTFEAPRNSMMAAIEHEIFDDHLLANFMKTRLHGDWETMSLHPHFTPFVAKYADNGQAKTRDEVDAYLAAYRKRAPMDYLMHVLERESERRVRKFIGVDTPAFKLMTKTYLFLKRA
jgi:hypothetical protein